MQSFKTRTLSSASVLVGGALLAAAVAGPASAQDTASPAASATVPGKDQIAPSNAGNESGDIVVTARKRAEDVQTVPISITAYTAQDLEERNIRSLADLSNTTPGVAITSAAAGNTLTVVLRGLAPAVTNNDLNVDANVGVFIDGIYQTSRNTLDIISILDLGQIEIAKGPQSALYGRSTFAGAVGISTRRPSHQFEASVTGSVAEDDDYRLRGTVSGPLVDGLLYARVGAGYIGFDGWGKNAAAPKNNLSGTRKYAGTASLELTPSDRFTAHLSGYYTHSANEMSALTLLPLSSFNCGTVNAATGVNTLYCGALKAPKTSDITPGIPRSIMKNAQVALDLNYRTDFAQFISVTGLSRSTSRNYNDYDGSSAGALLGVCTPGFPTAANTCSPLAAAPYSRLVRANLLSTGREKVRTFSQELRVQSLDGARFQWLLGGYYFRSRQPINNTAGIGVDRSGLAANERFVAVAPFNAPATGVGSYEFTANPFTVDNSLTQQLFGSYANAKTRTKSVFGSLGYTLGQLRVAAEGRYNWDTKEAQGFSITNALGTPGLYQPIDGVSVPAGSTFPVATPFFKQTFKVFTPRFTVDFRATPDILIYGSAAKGARSGGFNTANPVSATGILASEVAYKSETNWTYEAGVKSRLFDRHLLLDLSVFHTDWKNVQVSAFTQNPTATTPSNIVRNAGALKSTGAEAQVDYKFTDLIGVGGSVSYADPKFKNGAYDPSQIAQCRLGAGTAASPYSAAPGCPSLVTVTTPSGSVQVVPTLEGKRPLRSVKIQWNLHATAGAALSENWTLVGRVDVNHTGSAYINNINTASFGKRTLTNFRLALDNKQFSVAVFGNNIFDKTYVQNSIVQPRAGVPFAFRVPEIYLGQGRQIGVTATYKY